MKSFLLALACFVLAGCQDPNKRPTVEWEVEEIEVGYRGAARVNPYLAAERYLKQNGFDARSSRVWSDKEEQMGVIMMPASFLTTKGLGMRALEWVEEGGTLVITVKGGEADYEDFRAEAFSNESEETLMPGFEHLLDETGIKVTNYYWEHVPAEEKEGRFARPWNLAEFSVISDEVAEDFSVEFEGHTAMSVADGENWGRVSDDVGRMVTADYGLGQVMVLAHARPFRNAYIDRADHAEFLKLIANWRGERSIVFLFGSGTSFFNLLWQHSWMAMVGGLILLGFWLWMRIPRFGPLMDDDLIIQKGYGVQLMAAARFLWRKKQVHHYLRPIRERIEAQHDGDADTLYQNFASASGLSKDDVVEAMTSNTIKDPATLTRIAHNLQTLSTL